MKKILRPLLFIVFFSFLLQGVAKAEGEISGPSLLVDLGIRNKRSPNLDEYYSVLGGVKITAFSYNFSDQAFASFVGIGLGFENSMRFAPHLSPLVLGHVSGIGVSLDFFLVNKDRNDRPGGPMGLMINLDVFRMMKYMGL